MLDYDRLHRALLSSSISISSISIICSISASRSSTTSSDALSFSSSKVVGQDTLFHAGEQLLDTSEPPSPAGLKLAHGHLDGRAVSIGPVILSLELIGERLDLNLQLLCININGCLEYETVAAGTSRRL